MNNPWKDINLDDYEQHMSSENVQQLQTLNKLMKEQLSSYKVKSVMILGVAGGNGLSYIDKRNFDKVYGVDINETYLSACMERYLELKDVFEAICTDLTDKSVRLPHADLIIANLLVEYIGYECFQKIIKLVTPQYVSCVIQIDNDVSYVSDSPYIHVFERLDEIHHQINGNALICAMNEIGYEKQMYTEAELPNKKRLARIDFVC